MSDDQKPLQDTLTAEQKPLFENAIKLAAEEAVTKFKTDSEEARKKAVPEKYDVKFSDSTPLDPTADLEKIAAYAREQGFSNEQTQALLKHQEELASGILARHQESQKNGLTETIKRWETETWADKELGGANKEATLKRVHAAMDRFATPQLKELLNEAGYGNHPEWVRLMAKIGKAIEEDSTRVGRGFNGKTTPKSDAEVFYANK